MRITTFILSFILSLGCFAQVETTINVPTTAAASPTRPALLYLHPNYGSTTTRYPLLVFNHGAGQQGNNLSLIYNSSSAGGPAYYIEHSGWPSNGFLNPKTGLRDTFIVVSPQASSWSLQATQLNYVIKYMVDNYRVDTNRIYMTGLSAGGANTVYYISRINFDQSDNQSSFTPIYRLAAAVPMSAQIVTNPPQSWANTAVADSVRVYGFGSEASDIYGEATHNYVNRMNTAKSGIAIYQNYSGGHCCWNTVAYNPSVTYTISPYGAINMYQYLLTLSRGIQTAPIANAGSDQSITLPVSQVTLTGTATPGSGQSIVSTVWSKVSGTGGTIVSPNSLTTNVTGLSAGQYVFRLTVTGSGGLVSTDDVTITVNQPITVANAGPDQTITLPINTVALNGSSSTGNITSYTWTRVSGPNTPTIVNPTSVNTTVQGLIFGTYVFQLSCNNGESTDQIIVTVKNATPTGSCAPGGSKYVISPYPDSTLYMTATVPMAGLKTTDILPGDTIELDGSFTQASFVGLTGSSGCPITLINPRDGQTTIQNLNIESGTYLKIKGTGSPDFQYGFLFQKHPYLRYNWYAGIKINERSAHIEIDSCDFHNVGYGIIAETNGSCEDSLNYPNWVIDSLIIHDIRIVGTWNQGMYIGNTQPDNAKGVFDDRLVICDGDSTYPRPMRNGYTKIYNCIVDSTGRAGIQLSSASKGISEISNNLVKHNGLNGDPAQGANIVTGKYTHAYIHNNTVIGAYTYGIEVQGSSGTNIPLRIEDNYIDSSGYVRTYDLSQAPDSKAFYNPNTEPTFADTLTYARSITYIGRNNMDIDSMQFWIKRDTCGAVKDENKISIEEFGSLIQKVGNIVCSNLNKGTFTATSVNATPGIIYSTTSCSLAPSPNIPPTANAGADQTITLPTNSVTLIGSGSDPDGSIVAYKWTFPQGDSATIVSPNSATTNVTGLSVGVHVLQLEVSDDDGDKGIDNVVIVVNPARSGSLQPIRKTKGRKVIIKNYN